MSFNTVIDIWQMKYGTSAVCSHLLIQQWSHYYRELILIGFMQLLVTMICNNVLSISFQTFGAQLYIRGAIQSLNKFVLSFHFRETEKKERKIENEFGLKIHQQ